MLIATVAVCCFALAVPFTKLGTAFGFRPFPGVFLLYLLAIVVLCVISAELIKKLFYRKVRLR